jgi:hypothetical protein
MVAPMVMAHYMPWYQSPAVSGYWGWHWTMNHFNPEKMDSDGLREIASHHYPLVGPYDSRDEGILEYHTLLMKLSGLDGVIVDWYGMENFWDYGVIKESTHKLFQYIQKAGLTFVICYEDQTVGHMVDNGHLEKNQALAHGGDVLRYMQTHWFGDDHYVRISDHPVLMVFGPQYFFQASDWDAVFSPLTAMPLFFSLDNRLHPVATGAFPWPPMWAAKDNVLTREALNSYLQNFYQKAASWDYRIASAFPGFHDIYSEAGLGYSYGFLDDNNGETFDFTLRSALGHEPDILQIVTWNDFGEGTVVEPTIEFGYRYLEMIQDIKKSHIDSSFAFNHDDLTLPLTIYELRIKNSGDSGIQSALNTAVELIFSGEIEDASAIVDSIKSSTTLIPHDSEYPGAYSLEQNYPNPFNQQTTIHFKIPEPSLAAMTIYNTAGQVVHVLLNDNVDAGQHALVWDAADVSSGLYFYRITACDFSAGRKCLVLK